jgi:hypothetical protein
MHTKFLSETLKGIEEFEDISVAGRLICRQILQKQEDNEDRKKCWEDVVKFGIP